MTKAWQVAVISAFFTLGGLYRGEGELLIVATCLGVLYAWVRDPTSGRGLLISIVITGVPFMTLMFSLRLGAETRCSMYGAKHQVETRMDWQVKKCLHKTAEGWLIVNYATDEKS